MLLDLIAAVLLVLAVLKGYQRGLIVGLFSFVAIVVGLAAAMKLSVVVAAWLGKSVRVSQEWLPLLAFALVFIGVVILVRLAALALQKVAETAMLGWANRLGGVVFYVLLYGLVFSVVIFYLEQMQVLQKTTTAQSLTYPVLQPWGPRVINGLGAILPFFRDMFTELQEFFGKLSGV